MFLLRIRLGELSRQRILLASLCGHEPSRIVLQKPHNGWTFSFWVSRIVRHDPEARVRAAIAACWVAYQHWSLANRDIANREEFEREIRGQIQAIEDWILNPSRRTADRAKLYEHINDRGPSWLWHIAWAFGCGILDHRLSLLRSIQLAAEEANEHEVRAAIQKEILGWILGQDPVAQRSQAHRTV